MLAQGITESEAQAAQAQAGTGEAVPDSPIEWAQAETSIIHPTRGRIPFDPYPYQVQFLSTWKERRRIILKARQVGYSLVFAIESLFCARHIPESMILLVSRSQDMATNLLRYCYQVYNGLPGSVPDLTKQNESEMGFPNGSRIKSIPANRSTGRGFAASRVYLDEFAYADYADDIYQSISPAISQGGILTIASTPNVLGNLFHRLWLSDGFTKQRIDWRECPSYWTPEEKAQGIPAEQCAWYLDQRQYYTDAAWAAEYDCDFTVSGGQVFRRVREALLASRQEHHNHFVVAGIDFGQSQDYTVISSVCADCLEQTAIDRFNRAEWSVTRDRIRAFIQNNSVSLAIAERNSAGSPNVEALQNDGLPVVGFDTTPMTKRPLIQALALAFEKSQLHILSDGVQLNELEAYQMTFSPITHQPTYHAPQGTHDDTVIALALAWLGVSTPRNTERVVYAPVRIGGY